MNKTFNENYIERLETLQRELHQQIEGLPAQALDWEPGPEMNSIAVLLAHTSGSLRYWIGDAALGEPSGRDREAEFQTHGISGAQFQGRLEDTFAYLKKAIAQVSLEDLEKTGFAERGGQPVTRGWALLHALEHGFLHLGHVQMTSQLWKSRGY